MRTCPRCTISFSRCKKVNGERTCPSCGEFIHYLGKKTVLLADKKAAAALLDEFETEASRARGAPFSFEGQARQVQLSMCYDLLFRCREYLSRGQLRDAIEAYDFALGVIHRAFSTAQAAEISTLAWLLGQPWADLSSQVYREVRTQVIRSQAQARSVELYRRSYVSPEMLTYATL